jgi:uncharacterized protein
MGIMIISLIFMGLGALASARLKSKFKHYSEMPTSSRMSGAEIAKKMLNDNGIYDVQIVSTPGFLSDHYNPTNKTVNLSADVYEGRHVSAAAVAAHECGHAVQHATAYSMLQLRSKMVPVVKIGTNFGQYVLMIGAGMMFGSGNQTILLIGIIMFAATTLFSLVTLPVEFDASNRALKWLDTNNVMQGEEHAGAKDALKWAALTYVVAAVSSVVMLLYYVSMYLNRSRN